ncbi:MAG: ABC efflux transporter permease [Candidatus Desulfovibrio kirbyi]|uniref:ABC efflux transporter permease n=1 Tax=Candidatus Desulfovibrio kirbyi TaxID=2696086 RepID=A0A6L2R6W3_9BACT|nr:ABC transporter permease [Desulfovibrio sp.]GFH63275.1 MAG: ABC efflux transporter permease [Candidatus Desulfovibrio kirbyi]
MTRHAMFFRIIVSSLIRRRSRMLVALLAVVIGATVFLGMGAVYYDIPRQMGREFRSYGANLVLVSSGGNSVLSLDDAKRAIALLPADKLVGASPFRFETMYYNRQGVTVVGADFTAVKKTSPYWQIQGEWPQKDDEILIGTDIAEHTRLYAGSFVTLDIVPPKGRKISKELRISGVVRTGGAEDGFVIMPMSGLEGIMGVPGTANVVEISIAASGEELSRFIEVLQAESQGITPRLVKRIAASETTVLSRLQVLVYLVTGIVLFLTMICVGTTMMTVVMERRGEIGLKKAIGAGNKVIIAEFMGESTILAFAGWLLGIISGYFFAQIVSMSVFSRGVEMPFVLVLLALVASFVVTLLASLIPVSMSTDVEPALVLRGE